MDYLYYGKETDEELGLNWQNFGFRYYDNAIGRFTGVDKAVDKLRAVNALATTLSMVAETGINPQMYDSKTNSCATNCTRVSKSGGYNPPNLTAKHPGYLFKWFKTQ